MSLIFLLLLPLIISGTAFFVLNRTVTWKEFLLQVGLSFATVWVGWEVAKWGGMQDTENLNGRITSKVEGTQSCCHCRDVCDSRDKKGTCTSSHRECSHIVDYHWDLKTSVGNIPIESCSGWNNPPSVWVNARVGEPASLEHTYTNYLLSDPDSLMIHKNIERFSVPKYPGIRDYYKLDHVVGDVAIPNGLQQAIREINADLGKSNQLDLTVLLTSNSDPTYAQAVESKWLYGPKNSMTIVMGIEGPKIEWVRVMTFSKVEILKVRLRDQLQGLELNDPKVLEIIRQEVSTGFKRTAMAEFAYLASNATPRGWALALLYVFQILVSTGLVYWTHVKDVFGDERIRGWS